MAKHTRTEAEAAARWNQRAEGNTRTLAALKELLRCVRGGDRTAGVSMDDALIAADEAISEAEVA